MFVGLLRLVVVNCWWRLREWRRPTPVAFVSATWRARHLDQDGGAS
jgi:hypothetical protein